MAKTFEQLPVWVQKKLEFAVDEEAQRIASEENARESFADAAKAAIKAGFPKAQLGPMFGITRQAVQQRLKAAATGNARHFAGRGDGR